MDYPIPSKPGKLGDVAGRARPPAMTAHGIDGPRSLGEVARHAGGTEVIALIGSAAHARYHMIDVPRAAPQSLTVVREIDLAAADVTATAGRVVDVAKLLVSPAPPHCLARMIPEVASVVRDLPPRRPALP